MKHNVYYSTELGFLGIKNPTGVDGIDFLVIDAQCWENAWMEPIKLEKNYIPNFMTIDIPEGDLTSNTSLCERRFFIDDLWSQIEDCQNEIQSKLGELYILDRNGWSCATDGSCDGMESGEFLAELRATIADIKLG